MISIKHYLYSDILGWSVSRYETFTACKRRYYYQYYAKYDPTVSRDKIERLKNLTSVPLEIGNIVHKTISQFLKRLIKSTKEINRSKFQKFYERKTQIICEEKAFAEVHYGQMQSISKEDLLAEVSEALDSFLESDRRKWVSEVAIRGKNDWVIEPPGFGESRIDNMKVFCKVDFLFVVDKDVFILDWKTGREDERKHEKQLLGYCTWANKEHGVAEDRIEAIIAYLRPSYTEKTFKPQPNDIVGFVETIRSETNKMLEFCNNPEDNVPRQKDEFPMTEIHALCRFCNFRELCSR